MVRQRLAQIERNHSQISSQNSRSNAGTSVLIPETPEGNKKAANLPPSLFSKSGRSKGRAEVPYPMIERGKRRNSIPTPTSMNRNSSTMARKHSLEGHTSSLAVRSLLDESHHQYAINRFKGDEHMSKAQRTKKGIEKLSMQVMDVKGVLGGESGYPTIHRIVLGLDDKARDNGKALKTIQEHIDKLEDRWATTTAAAVALDKGVAELNNFKGQDSVLHAIEDVKSRLATELPLVIATMQSLQSKQDRLLELSTSREKEGHHSDVATSEGAHKSTDSLSDFKPVLNKLDELRVLFEASSKAIEKNEVKEQPTELTEVRFCSYK